MLVKDVALYLVSKGVAVLGTSIRFGDITSDIDNMIFVVDGGGDANIYTSESMFQVRILVRDKLYTASNLKAQEVFSWMHNKSDPFVGVTGVVSSIKYMYCPEHPEYLSQDTRSRYHWEILAVLYGRLNA